MLKRQIAILAVAGALASGAAVAEERRAPSLGEELDAAVEDAVRALEGFIDRFPGYEAPEITPKGDIIIRKKPPAPVRRKQVEPREDQSRA